MGMNAYHQYPPIPCFFVVLQKILGVGRETYKMGRQSIIKQTKNMQFAYDVNPL